MKKENEKYLKILQLAIWNLRLKFRESGNKEDHDLLDLIENLPALLCYEEKIDNERLKRAVLDYEEKYLNKEKVYSKYFE